MKKKFLFLCLLTTLLLSGCLEKNLPGDGKNIDIESKQKALDDKLNEFGKDGEINPEEAKELDKLKQDIKNEEAKKIEDQYNMVTSLENLEENKKSGKAARGSCDAIADASTCIEYVGSMWTETQMRLNCEGSGNFSLNPCPSGMAGGCNIGVGTITDMMSWFYLTGGGEITPASLNSAKNACNNNQMGKWVTGGR